MCAAIDDETVERFLRASVGYRIGRAVRILAEKPEIAGHSIATALVLGDQRQVRGALDRDPGLAARRDPRTGWAPLHVVCASRWHLDPARAAGLLTTARLLIEHGADVHERSTGQRCWLPLRCAVISAASSNNNEPIIRLLLEHGATPDDETLYDAGWAADPARLLAVLIEHGANVRELAEHALAAPIASKNLKAARMLLQAGADPRRYRNDDGDPVSVIAEALQAGCETELIELLLAHGADPQAPGRDSRSPYRLAATAGRTDVLELLDRHGARENISELDRLIYACRRGDRPGALQAIAEHPDLAQELSSEQTAAAAFISAAQAGDVEAVRLMLDIGLPVDVRGVADGQTALHAAAYQGSAESVRLLLQRGADLQAPDTTWGSPPLVWAIIGSGERPGHASESDWVATVTLLLDAGASTDGITLSPEEEKPPSAEVARLLRERGLKQPPSA